MDVRECRVEDLRSILAIYNDVPIASALGKHVMIAGIDADNAASIRMHERLGFFRAAHFRQVGFKFGRWLDLVFLQRYVDQQ